MAVKSYTQTSTFFCSNEDCVTETETVQKFKIFKIMKKVRILSYSKEKNQTLKLNYEIKV